jgi:hypothetical protein
MEACLGHRVIALYLLVAIWAVLSLAALAIYIPYEIAGQFASAHRLRIGDILMSAAVWAVLILMFLVLAWAAAICAAFDALISLFKYLRVGRHPAKSIEKAPPCSRF